MYVGVLIFFFFSFTVHQNNITTHCLLFFSLKTMLSLVIQLIKRHFVRLQISTWKADENVFFFHRILREFSWRIQIEIRVEGSIFQMLFFLNKLEKILNLKKHKPKGLIQVLESAGSCFENGFSCWCSHLVKLERCCD